MNEIEDMFNERDKTNKVLDFFKKFIKDSNFQTAEVKAEQNVTVIHVSKEKILSQLDAIQEKHNLISNNKLNRKLDKMPLSLDENM